MSLELLIAANTAALEANTAALREVLSNAGANAPAAPAPKATKTAKTKETPAPVVEETPAPVVEETPAPVVEETPAPAPVVEETPAPVEVAPFDRDAAIQKITLLVRTAFTASGAGLQAKKDEYEVIRKNFGVATAKDLRDDQFADFIAAVEKL
jgi:outer membrane biosynthesis protein TonB